MRTSATVQAFRDHPRLARMPKEFVRVAVWAMGYSDEEVPDRAVICRAVVSVLGGPRGH